jgi:penicillin amidase
MKRDPGGVPRLKGKSLEEVFMRLGEAHAADRAAQMALMRIIGQGRATECISDDEALLDVDQFFRWLGLYRGADDQVVMMHTRERKILDAYCEGVNRTMTDRRKPMPFRIWGYTWEAWQPKDIVLLIRLMAWVGLVSGQVNVEKAVVEMIQHGVSEERLRELMSPHLDGCDFDLVRRTQVVGRLTPAAFEAQGAIGSLASSNNWVVSAEKSASGFPMLANDPHLEINRLPPVWYEVVMELEDNYIMGTTVPGLPGVVTGRNRDLAWGITYTEADMTDFFVEECKGGRYLREGQWKPFEKIEETIRRRKKGAETVKVFRNEHGLLLGDPNEVGRYLCLAWTAWHASFSDIIEAIYKINLGRSVQEGMEAARRFHYPSLNWVFADRKGNIGYQMSGLFPKRRKGWSGLYPVAGWQSENDWQGWIPHEEVPSALNPPEGFFSTANQDLSRFGRTPVQNCPMPDHRSRRIGQMLGAKERLTPADMQEIQLDVLSTKARDLAPVFLKHVSDKAQSELLRKWDLRYTPQSEAATLFEELYRAALKAILCGDGKGGFPPQLLDYLMDETSAYLNMDAFFAGLFTTGKSSWFGKRSLEGILEEAFKEVKGGTRPPWGASNRLTMVNIYYGGKLPRILGLDRGPFEVPGSPDTPRQGSIYRDAGRLTSFCPSYRFVTDMGTDEAWTVIPGGPSEKRLSRYYLADLKAYWRGGYKKIEGVKRK